MLQTLHRPLICALFLGILYAFPHPAYAQGGPTIFTDVSAAAGITNNRIGRDKVAGQAWGDYDNDGWPDLYVTDHEGPNRLYRNNGDGTFALSVLSDSVALPDSYSGGAIFVDYDNDGWRDLYVLNWGANVLYHNEGGTAFVDVTASAGIGDTSNGKSASWGDFNNDGWLDLYVANWNCYPNCGRPSIGDIDRLYQSNGDGTFTNVTKYLTGKTAGSGFIASFTDYDNDGDLDIYLVNDEFINPVGNGLWRNDGPGCKGWCFAEVSTEAGANTKVMGMGLATADYDNDGDQDFYFSNAGPMTLLQNQGDGTFVNKAVAAGVDSAGSIGWGTVFFDYDNDGWLDLYLAVSDAAKAEETPGSHPINPLFHNNGDGTFANVTEQSGAADTGSTIGVAYADYDRDGRLDLLVGNLDTGYQLYRNQAATAGNHWLAVELVGGGPVNRDAVGSRVYLTTADGQTRMQEVICGSSVGAGNELALHFGLGDQSQVAAVTVRWPDGTEQTYANLAVDQRVRLQYGTETVDTTTAAAVELPTVSTQLSIPAGPFRQLLWLIAMVLGM